MCALLLARSLAARSITGHSRSTIASAGLAVPRRTQIPGVVHGHVHALTGLGAVRVAGIASDEPPRKTGGHPQARGALSVGLWRLLPRAFGALGDGVSPRRPLAPVRRKRSAR